MEIFLYCTAAGILSLMINMIWNKVHSKLKKDEVNEYENEMEKRKFVEEEKTSYAHIRDFEILTDDPNDIYVFDEAMEEEQQNTTLGDAKSDIPIGHLLLWYNVNGLWNFYSMKKKSIKIGESNKCDIKILAGNKSVREYYADITAESDGFRIQYPNEYKDKKTNKKCEIRVDGKPISGSYLFNKDLTVIKIGKKILNVQISGSDF